MSRLWVFDFSDSTIVTIICRLICNDTNQLLGFFPLLFESCLCAEVTELNTAAAAAAGSHVDMWPYLPLSLSEHQSISPQSHEQTGADQ